MVCNEVKERLSEYLDGVLPKETKTWVDQHLSACTGCRKELESLKTVVRELNTLHQLEAPGDFLQQLHARMTERPWHQRLLRSLYLPVRFKVPIQVAGAVTVAILIFSIVTLQQHEKDRLLPPPVVSERELKKDEHGTTAGRPASPRGVAGPGRAGSQAKPDEIRGKQATAPSEGLWSDEIAGTKATADPQRVMAMVLRVPTNRPSATQDKTSRGPVGSEAVQLQTRREAPLDPLVHELKALADRCGGKVVASAYDEASGRLDSIEIEIPSSQYEALAQGLKRLGEMESPGNVPEAGLGTVKVSIKVVSGK